MLVRGTERSKKTKNKPSTKPPSKSHDIASFPTHCPSVANCAQGKQQGAKAGYKPTGKKIISTPSQSQDSHFVPCNSKQIINYVLEVKTCCTGFYRSNWYAEM